MFFYICKNERYFYNLHENVTCNKNAIIICLYYKLYMKIRSLLLYNNYKVYCYVGLKFIMRLKGENTFLYNKRIKVINCIYYNSFVTKTQYFKSYGVHEHSVRYKEISIRLHRNLLKLQNFDIHIYNS